MRKKAKFPYDYRTVLLKNGKGTATIIGEPTPELMNAINALAEAAYKKLNSEQGVQVSDTTNAQSIKRVL